MDPTDPGLSEGCYADDSPDTIYARTLETDTTHARQIDALDGHGPISGVPIDTFDRHGSLPEGEPHKTDPDCDSFV
jgi:hypothetical protein